MYEPIDLVKYDVTSERGFLPKHDPAIYLSPAFQYWEGFAGEMPALLAAGTFGKYLRNMLVIDTCGLTDEELAPAHVRLTFLLHGYMHECQKNNLSIRVPACLGVPLTVISKRLGLPPVLSYSPYALNNWRRLDPEGPIALGNLAVLQHFLGGLDEAWFILVHIEIETHAGQAIIAAVRAQEAAAQNDLAEVARQLKIMATAQERMYKTLCRMLECCDPYIYFRRVRPYLFVPAGVVFEGVSPLDGTPQPFRGETGAQSTIAPLFDAVLGIVHEPSNLSSHLAEMRWYMPPKHRALLEKVEGREPVSRIVQVVHKLHDALMAYNECVEWLAKFRDKHYEYAASYINKQANRSSTSASSNPTDIGTGGTQVMASLRKHLDQTPPAIF